VHERHDDEHPHAGFAMTPSKEDEEDEEEEEAPPSRRLNFLEALRVAGYAAPRLRGTRARPIKTYDSATGETTGEITSIDLTQNLLTRVGVEFDVEPGKRRTKAICKKCSRVFSPRQGGNAKPSEYCSWCRAGRCEKCGKPRKVNIYGSKSHVAKPICVKCAGPPKTKPLLPCSMCGEPATCRSSMNARNGYAKNAFCARHRKGSHQAKPPLPCAVCGEPATRASSTAARSARNKGQRTYCAKHKRGRA
jgi:hypothetical protein